MANNPGRHVPLPAWADLSVALLKWAAQDCFSQDEKPRLLPRPEDIRDLGDRGIDSLYYWTLDELHPQQRLYDEVQALQTVAIEQVLQSFSERKIPVLVFKGAAFARRWRVPGAFGIMVDCDMLVPRSSIEDARAVMYALGYKHSAFSHELGQLVDRDVIETAQAESVHYELTPFNRAVPFAYAVPPDDIVYPFDRMPLWRNDENLSLIIEFDIHHGVASDIQSEPFFERAVRSSTGLPTFSDTDHLWFGLARYYAEVTLHSKRSLRDLAYLAPLLRFGDIDWALLTEMTNSSQTNPSLFHMLTFLDYLAPGTLPAFVLDEIDPLKQTRFRDWGSVVPQLFGFVDPLHHDFATLFRSPS